MTKAMLEEVKTRLRRTMAGKLEQFDEDNPEPEIPERVMRKVEKDRKTWRQRRSRYEDQLRKAYGKFFDRIVFDHENAMLLIRDFDKWEPPR